MFDYVHLRLVESGWPGDSPFEHKDCEVLATLSGGRPARLNEVAREVLYTQAVRSQGSHWRALLTPRVYAGAGAATVLFLAVLVWAVWPSDAPSSSPQPAL